MSKRKSEQQEENKVCKRIKTTKSNLQAFVSYVDHRRKIDSDCDYCSEAGPQDCDCSRDSNETFVYDFPSQIDIKDLTTLSAEQLTEIKDALIVHVWDKWHNEGDTEHSDFPAAFLDDEKELMDFTPAEIWKLVNDPKEQKGDQNVARLFNTISSATIVVGFDHGRLSE